jgi:hypothetical protein
VVLVTFVTALLTYSPLVSSYFVTCLHALNQSLQIAHTFTLYNHYNTQDPRFMNAVTRMPSQSYIWDISNPNTPDVELLPPSPLCCLRYNPKSTDTLVSSTKDHLYHIYLYVIYKNEVYNTTITTTTTTTVVYINISQHVA